MAKHIIPQEFNQADKIGKFTMPQAAVLAIGAAIFILVVITQGLIVSLISAIPIALVTFIFMFVKVNKVPLYEFVMIYVLYIGTPKLLIYRSENMKSEDEMEEQIGFIESDKSKKPSSTTKKQSKNPKSSSKQKPKDQKPKSQEMSKTKVVQPKKISSVNQKQKNIRKKG